ncbi:MAG: Holliday junction branch migration protein RuvA [Gammaproteobacteria bacterium]|nr:Holliday junction branch migration protein RuvA [Gammaproteobacteria bacterium]
MIGFIRGKILQKQPPILLVDVNGVGYELESPMPVFYELPDEGQEISLFVHLVVREDAQLLYGFTDQGQKDLFRNLLKVNGVGPKVALAILSTLDLQDFLHCIYSDDFSTLIKVPGIGKKTAERMMVELRDRVDLPTPQGEPPGASGTRKIPDSPVQDAIGALIALGYKPAEAGKAVRAVNDHRDKRDDLIRNALQYLAVR